MALRKSQKEMAISLFAKVFSTTKDEKEEIGNYVHMQRH